MSKTVFIKSHKLIVIFFLIVNCAITVAVKSDPTQTIKSKHGFFANEMFCGDRNYPIPTMTKGDRDFTKDCYKIGSFTNMESLFNSKKILKSEKLYSLEYANIANTSRLKIALADLIDNYPLIALIVAKNNKIVTEYYGYSRKANQRFASFSMHKSLNALLIGIAYEQRLIKNLDEPVVEYLEELSNTEWASITIRQLLTMTSGIKVEQRKMLVPLLFGNSKILELVINQDSRVSPPGNIFSYNDANTLILGKVIERVFNKTWNKVFESEVWLKIGSEDNASVLTSERGEVLTNAFFNARPRDYLRLGLLMVNNGKNFLGEQLISINWMNKMFGRDPEFTDCPIGAGKNCPGLGPFGYTYQTWRTPSGSAIFFMGKYGQLIFVHPASKTVAVILSATKSGRWVHVFTKEMKIFLRELAI
jgi:CubicO group peptidase (beta-lactamase class C family)